MRSGNNKVTLNNTSKHFFKKPNFTDKTVATNWDPKISHTRNMARIGLNGDCNGEADMVGRVKRGKGHRDSAKVITLESLADGKKAIELFDIPADGIIKGKRRSDIMLDQSVDEQKYIYKCIKKHGVNYSKMHMDIKTNRDQITATKLEKKVKKFLSLSDKDRVVEVDEKVLEELRALV